MTLLNSYLNLNLDLNLSPNSSREILTPTHVSMRFLLRAFFTLTLLSSASAAHAYNPELNTRLGAYLKIPFYFNAPYDSFTPLPTPLMPNTILKSSDAHSPLLIDYYESSQQAHEAHPEADLGLRLIVVRADLDRKLNSQKLAASQVFETGDIVLSFRREWFRTLKYSHIQLGISHAGLLYFEKGSDGQVYLRNLDMPMDNKHVGNGFLDSDHYLGAPLLHVVRARNLTNPQKQNLAKWLRRLSRVGPKAYAKGTIRFNQDYSAPKFHPEEPLSFVGDLGRIALELPIKKQLTHYCSEFAWSVLSLRNCDPDSPSVLAAFQNEAAPGCITEIFRPMPVLGTVTTASDPAMLNLTVGLADGPTLLARTQAPYIEDPHLRNQVIDKLLERSLIHEAKGNPDNISSGHRAVEEALLAQNPQFFNLLVRYYQLANDAGAENNPEILTYRQAFNSAQKPNYSPTAFMLHAILPPQAETLKTMSYVGTIFYAPKLKLKNGHSLQVYDLLRQRLRQPAE